MWPIINNLFNNTDKSRDLTNSIVFTVNENNQISLTVDIKNSSLEAAQKLGLLLFLVNEGYYVQSFLDIISDLSKTHKNSALFQQQVISTWSEKITESNMHEATQHLDDIPIIKPTQFNTKS